MKEYADQEEPRSERGTEGLDQSLARSYQICVHVLYSAELISQSHNKRRFINSVSPP